MNTHFTLRIAPVLLATAIVLVVVVPAAAGSTDELLEKGIYTEQTVGDLSAAIAIYTRVVEDADANRPHAAQALFRLGMCHLKTGNDAEAKLALDKLIQEYPEQEQLVAQAREQLASARPALALGSVPWKDGESLEYRIALPTGKALGALYLRAELTRIDGADAWRLETRRFAGSADNYGVSRVLVDHDTQRPIRSSIRHGMLGNADATYGPEGAEITSADTVTHVDSEQQLFDNDQALHLIRMLPLGIGYKTRINLLPIWTQAILDAGLEVTGKEVCQVPAGEFECYVVELDIGQTFWFSTGPEQRLVKVKAGGVVIELTEIDHTDPGASIAYELEDFGLSGELPAGWLSYEHRVPGRANKAMVRFLDPEAAAISAVEIDRCPQGRCPTLQQTAERELQGAQERFEAYTLRDGSWTESTIDGRSAIGFVGDYTRNGKAWVQYRLYTITDELRLEFIFRAPADRFEDLRATLDSVAENIEAK